jgi:hypothetical protein
MAKVVSQITMWYGMVDVMDNSNMQGVGIFCLVTTI